jgi:hypothetical protein
MTLAASAASIANTVRDYRVGEIPPISDVTVLNWANQFDPADRALLLSELDHVLRHIYLSRQECTQYFRTLIRHQPLTGGATVDFWKHTQFLDIQKNGNSQREFLPLFNAELRTLTGLELKDCGQKNIRQYLYLDDVLFTGGRAGTDLATWISTHAPGTCTLHLAFMVTHSLGEWQVRKRLNKIAEDCGKQVDIQIWRSVELENRRAYANSSDVLWPAVAPQSTDFLQLNAAQRFPFAPRQAVTPFRAVMFSSEAGRQHLENQMLSAGLHIRTLPQNPSPALRPLGFGPYGMGFGSTIVTFRNCPNNTPLALWWGDPDADSSHPFSKWTPLFPRKTYDAASAFKDFF